MARIRREVGEKIGIYIIAWLSLLGSDHISVLNFDILVYFSTPPTTNLHAVAAAAGVLHGGTFEKMLGRKTGEKQRRRARKMSNCE